MGVKRPGREADNLPSSSAETKNVWIYSPYPQYAVTAWCSFEAQGHLYLLYLNLHDSGPVLSTSSLLIYPSPSRLSEWTSSNASPIEIRTGVYFSLATCTAHHSFQDWNILTILADASLKLYVTSMLLFFREPLFTTHLHLHSYLVLEEIRRSLTRPTAIFRKLLDKIQSGEVWHT
jgi:hypothetical protein